MRPLVIALLVLVVGYGVLKIWPLVSGPRLVVDSPPAYASLPDGYVVIRGVAENTESLVLNDGQLLIDQEGRFEKILLLAPGGAIITLTATDRFGRSTTMRRSVFIP